MLLFPYELPVPNIQPFLFVVPLSVSRLLALFISFKVRNFPRGGLLFVDDRVFTLDVKFLKFFYELIDENTVSIGEAIISPTLISYLVTKSVTFS